MANFDINSRFNKEANFSQVVFGEDGVLLETELNEMQHIQEEARKLLIKSQVYSGLLSELEYEHYTVTSNGFRLAKEVVANVNGNLITLPKYLEIDLGEAPTEDFISLSTGRVGYRDDLVFLEVWEEEVTYEDDINIYGNANGSVISNHIKDGRVGVETTRRTQVKWRVNVAYDVDFNTFEFGFVSEGTGWENAVKAQGGRESIDLTTNFNEQSCYYRFSDRDNPARYDLGLYVCGNGTDASKKYLQTVDGYSYAIPLSKVRRRNSGAFSANNPNGAGYNLSVGVRRTTLKQHEIGIFTCTSSITYDELNVGDRLHLITYGDLLVTGVLVLEKLNSETREIRVEFLGSAGCPSNENTYCKYALDSRPDSLFYNIIHESDVVNLSKVVAMQGYDYHKLLEESFDKLMKGELQTKSGHKLQKTYHGLPHLPIDSHTVFYASYNKTVEPEINKLNFVCNPNFVDYAPSIQGHGLVTNSIGFNITLSNGTLDRSKPMCLEFTARIIGALGALPRFIALADSDSRYSRNICMALPVNVVGENIHYRFDIDFINNFVTVYINGRIYESRTKSFTPSEDNGFIFRLSDGNLNSYTVGNVAISDVRISDILRGDNFSNLPKDVILEEAFLAPAFNDQRHTFGDPALSQVTTQLVKATDLPSEHFGVSQATKGVWASGDSFNIYSSGNGIITGVADTNTAITVVTKVGTTTSTYVKDVSKFLVGDSIRFIQPDSYNVSTETHITHIDVENKLITFSPSVHTDGGSTSVWTAHTNYLVVESTISSSSPIISYISDGSAVAVQGVWSGLGTDSVRFTFGTNANLSNQDIQISYSLGDVSGTRALNQVLTEATTGEYNGHKLIKSSSITILDDFKGKNGVSTVECPHKFYRMGDGYGTPQPTYINPLDPDDCTEDYYDKRIENLDGQLCTNRAIGNGTMPQQLFSFDLVRIVEDKFGEIPAIDKVAWIKSNLESIAFTYRGYGQCPTGYKARIRCFITNSNTWGWDDSANYCTTSEEVSLLSGVRISPLDNAIDDNGFTHFLATTDPSDGEILSLIYTDFVKLVITLKNPNPTYSILSPSNTRRDAGMSGALFVRESTREVKRLDLGSVDETSNIITYGTYLPYQAIIESASVVNYQPILIPDIAFVSTLGTGDAPVDNAQNLYRNSVFNVVGSKNVNLHDALCEKIELTKSEYCSGCVTKIGLSVFHNNSLLKYANSIDTQRISDRTNNFFSFTPVLLERDGEIVMAVCSRFDWDKSFGIGSGSSTNLFRLNGIPTVKGSV